MNAAEHFDFDHIHTTPEGRHFRHGDGAEVDGEGDPLDPATISRDALRQRLESVMGLKPDYKVDVLESGECVVNYFPGEFLSLGNEVARFTVATDERLSAGSLAHKIGLEKWLEFSEYDPRG